MENRPNRWKSNGVTIHNYPFPCFFCGFSYEITIFLSPVLQIPCEKLFRPKKQLQIQSQKVFGAVGYGFSYGFSVGFPTKSPFSYGFPTFFPHFGWVKSQRPRLLALRG